MFDDQLLETLGWYMLGVFSYKIGSALFRQAQAINIFDEMVLYSLTALKISYENLLSAQELKIDALKKAGAEQDIIESAKRLDDDFVDTWKTTSLYVLRKSIPMPFKSTATFKNWFQAMQYLDKRTKKN